MVYAVFFNRLLLGPASVKGLAFGLVLWLASQLLVVPMIGAGLFCSHMGGARSLADFRDADLCFNYLGRVNSGLDLHSPLRPIEAPLGDLSDRRNPRRYPLEVNALVRGSQLQVSLIDNRTSRKESIADFAALLESFLASLLARDWVAPTSRRQNVA